jgi:WD40 repeat protein
MTAFDLERRAWTAMNMSLRATADQDPTSGKYDVFISYSHGLDRDFAAALQRGLEKFGKPWNRLRAMRVFRDDASLSANPDLWSSIETALHDSRWFLLLASPEAAASPWVDRETQWWLENAPRSRLLVVVTAGEIRTDDRTGRFNPDGSTSLPPALMSTLAGVPRWIDARWARRAPEISMEHDLLQRTVADVASAVHGRPKDELYGDAVREHRRTRRLARAAVTTLAVLFVSALVAAAIAVVQRNEAVELARISLSRQLAATADSRLTSELDVANLLAAYAFRTDPNPQTRAALLRAVTTSEHLVRFLQFEEHVSALEGSGDGRVIVAGLRDGQVVRWVLGAPAPETVARLPSEVADLSIDHAGTTVAAAGGGVAVVWRDPSGTLRFDTVDELSPTAVAVTPSGRTAIVYREQDGWERSTSVEVVALPGGEVLTHMMDPHPEMHKRPSILIARSDEEAFLLNTGYGAWERRRLPDWTTIEGSTAGFGAHNYGVGVSGDGQWFTYTNGATPIPIWHAIGETDPFGPAATAEAPLSPVSSRVLPLALSSDGSRAAVADSGLIHVVPAVMEGAPKVAALSLAGQGSVNRDGLRFLGDGDHLISASGKTVAVWHLTQHDRISTAISVSTSSGCGACPPPRVVISPDGSKIAVGDNDGIWELITIADNKVPHRVGLAELDGYVGPLVWSADGSRLEVPIVAAGSEIIQPTAISSVVRAWPVSFDSDLAGAGRSADGTGVIVTSRDGGIQLINPNTGAVVSAIPPPTSPEGRGATTFASAISPQSDFVALLDESGMLLSTTGSGGPVSVVDVRTGARTGFVEGTDIQYVTFAGGHLLVQRDSGVLEVWNESGTALVRLIKGDTNDVWEPIGSANGALIARQRSDSTVVLVDLATGTALTTLPPGDIPPGSRTSLAFDPNGRYLVTVTEAGEIAAAELVYRNVSDEHLVQTACRTAGRDLTPSEWTALVGTVPPDDLQCG